ncbi:MAG: class I SAM-dependent methyltransferase [Victivallales bacterium]|nr:class I SAM-dependent methyltransferase [Victivallales bacterium]
MKLYLGSKRDASLLRRHPWIFSGAVNRMDGAPEAGETVEVHSTSGQWLARAAYSPASQIRARVWTFDPEEMVDEAFFARRLQAAREYRERLGLWSQDACRMVHGEADGLPALVVDRYGAYLSCQFLSAGTERWKEVIVNELSKLPGIKGIYERSDADARRREGLELADGVLWGEEPPENLTICENGLTMRVNLPGGHKTGYYLDQRENRLAVDGVSADADVLDCCCYSGAFGLRAAKAGAKSVLFLDDAAGAIELTRANAVFNGLANDSRLKFQTGDMFTALRKFRDERRSFDVIVLDPPKFAATHGQLLRAAKGYKDINLLACKLLRKNGTLLTFSCSAAMTPEFFRKIVAEALTDAGRTARVVRSFSQAPDHPQALNFPEGHYLTGLQLAISN